MNYYQKGYEDAIMRGPKTQAGIRMVRSLSGDDATAYRQGLRDGLVEIHKPRLTTSDIRADLEYPVHTEFIGEDND